MTDLARLPWKLIGAGLAAFAGGLFLVRRAQAPSGSGPSGDAGGFFGPPDPLPPSASSAPVEPWMAGPEPADTCGPPQVGTKLFRQWALQKWGQKAGSPENITRACTPDKVDEHEAGRAWDLMTNSLEHGQGIVDALTAIGPSGEVAELARRAGIMYMIWNKQIWRAYPKGGEPAGSWGPYSGASLHTDHVHMSFSKAGGAGETSLYPIIRAEMGVA